MKQLYIFDFDGVLVDTILDSIICFNQALTEFDLPTYSEDISEFRHEKFWAFIKENVEGRETEFRDRFLELYENNSHENTWAYPGMVETLETLSAKGKTLAICSNREEKDVVMLCEKYLSTIDFKYISGYNEGIPNKPNPYRLNKIIESEKTNKEDVLYIGDRIVDVETAINAGVDMVMVRYGQGNPEDFSHEYPLKVIDSPKELLEI